MPNYTCGLCGKQYPDSLDYVKCVQNCYETMIRKQKEKERIEEALDSAERQKQIKDLIQELSSLLAEEYQNDRSMERGAFDFSPFFSVRI